MPLAEQVSTEYGYSQHVNPQSGDAGIRRSAANLRPDACYARRFTDALALAGIGLSLGWGVLTI
jgi:hypothetical protein